MKRIVQLIRSIFEDKDENIYNVCRNAKGEVKDYCKTEYFK